METTLKQYSDYMARFENHVGLAMNLPASTIDQVFAQDLNRKTHQKSKSGIIKDHLKRQTEVRPKEMVIEENYVTDRIPIKRRVLAAGQSIPEIAQMLKKDHREKVEQIRTL
jgi:hypothetical protein